MKKLALSLAVLFAVGMVSCGGNKDNNAADTTVQVEEMAGEIVTDSVNPDTTAVAGAAVTETTTEAAPKEEAAKEENKDAAAPAETPAEAPAETPAK